jgi:SAM-dependent methyltransferase
MPVLPTPPRNSGLELLDAPHAVTHELPGNLRDIRRLNRWFGGSALAVRSVASIVGNRRDVSLLDVATGSADIPIALHRWGCDHGRVLTVTACDISDEVLAEARRVVGDRPIRIVAADACDLPWPDGSFDIGLCSLALHHFDPDRAVTVLRELWRVARRGLVITDLSRGYAAYAGTWLATRTVARNRLTRHDGPLSVLRAYTPDELRALARSAGLPGPRVTTAPFFRQVLIAVRPAVST